MDQDGNCIGFVRLVAGQVTIFGRDPSCNVILDHASISRKVGFALIFSIVLSFYLYYLFLLPTMFCFTERAYLLLFYCVQHAQVETRGDTLILTDLRSRHGTFVNGKLLKSGQEIVLSDSDGVRFGSSTRSYIVRIKGF